MSADRIDNCSVCSVSLEYLEDKETLSCYFCGMQASTDVWCPEGHFVCESCYNMSVLDFIDETVRTSRATNPYDLASIMMTYPRLASYRNPCEHALVFAAAMLIAVKNEGTIKISSEDILIALGTIQCDENNLEFCGPDAAYGCCMRSGIIATFGTIFKAAEGDAEPDSVTVRVIRRVIKSLSDNTEQHKCLKNIVLTTMDLFTPIIQARFGVRLEGSAHEIICYQIGQARDCSPTTCHYSPLLSAK